MSRERGHTEVNYIDMLITLDYLFNKTDEKHPAYALRMCEYAKEEYGLTYNGGNAGDQVKRQRFSQCLDFLWDVYNNYPGALPFSLKKKKSGKYYIENKCNLNDEQKMRILASIKNDKYISDRDSEVMIDNLLYLFSNEYNREQYEDAIEKSGKGIRRIKSINRKKIKLIEEALANNLVIHINTKRYLKDGKYIEKDARCRVYSLKEYQGKPYAILIDIIKGYIICDAIENLDIYDDIYEDFERELDEQLREGTHIYMNIEELVDKNIIPISRVFIRTTFGFKKENMELVKNSFEYFFFKDLPMQENDRGDYVVSNLSINKDSFLSWLNSDPLGTNKICILDLLDFVEPEEIYRFIGLYYLAKLEKYKKYFDDIGLNSREYLHK